MLRDVPWLRFLISLQVRANLFLLQARRQAGAHEVPPCWNADAALTQISIYNRWQGPSFLASGCVPTHIAAKVMNRDTNRSRDIQQLMLMLHLIRHSGSDACSCTSEHSTQASAVMCGRIYDRHPFRCNLTPALGCMQACYQNQFDADICHWQI